VDDRNSFFAHAVTFLVAFVGDDDDGDEVVPTECMAPFIERIARFVADAPACRSAVVDAVAGVLADARLARDAG
jgi:hypothetical protein